MKLDGLPGEFCTDCQPPDWFPRDRAFAKHQRKGRHRNMSPMEFDRQRLRESRRTDALSITAALLIGAVGVKMLLDGDWLIALVEFVLAGMQFVVMRRRHQNAAYWARQRTDIGIAEMRERGEL